jgi:dimethylargininase
MLTAITRAVSPSMNACELTYREREAIDVARAREQHRAYEACLAELGVEVISLAAEPDYPDAVFVEDAGVVLDEIAVMTRLGAASRRGESESLARALERYRPLCWLREPATLDGGDVMLAGKTLFVGVTARSNAAGAGQLAAAVVPFGYRVRPVVV